MLQQPIEEEPLDAARTRPSAEVTRSSERLRLRKVVPIGLSPATVASFRDRFDDLLTVAYSAAYRILGDAGRAEDVAQEALVRAMMRWEKVEDYAEPWVSRVATNLAIDEWRKNRSIPDPDIDVQIDDHSMGVVQRDDLRRAFDSLPDRQREAITLRLIGGYNPNEAAKAMGISVAGVLKHTTRGLARLRLSLGDQIPLRIEADADV